MNGEWAASIESERAWRNDLYLGDETPLGPEARSRFRGLRWWPADPRFRVGPVRLVRHPVPLEGRVGATGPDAVRMLEVGAFEFALLGARGRLFVYEPAPGESDEAYLLVPFRDATSGTGTYGGGRYLDLEPVPGDVYELDFNRAYHPYCAYDEGWACVLPPPDNRLPLRVEAGERL